MNGSSVTPLGIVFGAVFIAGCANPAGNQPIGSPMSGAPVFTASAKPARITERKANPKGGVLILMYHKFAEKETRYDRSYDHFRHDLDRLYEMGFRPVTISEYLSDDMHIASGASPVVITIDDANPSQFTMDDKGNVDPNCCVGIWQEFARTHPDFPVKATWYVLPPIMWGQRKWEDKKIQMLTQSGSELGCHTWSHPSLRTLNDKQVRTEIQRSLDFLSKHGFDKVSFAYPYGVYPRHMDVFDGFWKNHRSYQMTGAVTCDTDIAPAPASDDLRPFKIPRVEAIEGPGGIDAWLDRIQAGKVKVFVAP